MKRRERRGAESRRGENPLVLPLCVPLRLCVLCVLILLHGGVWTTLPAQDCNLNGVQDADDIEAGTSEDCNGNGIPDGCEVVPLVFGENAEPLIYRGEPRALASGDLDGDGAADLVIGTFDDLEGVVSTLSLFFGRGGRDFAPELALTATRLSAIAVADLDLDGTLDLVTANRDVLRVYPNDQDGGGLGIPLEVAVSSGVEELVVADIDTDGRSDLVTLNPTGGTVAWHPNVAEAGFGAERAFEVVAPLRSSSIARSYLVAGDFDGDARSDLAVAATRSLTVTVIRNVSGGGAFEPVHELQSPGRSVAFASGDVNGDGLADLVGATTRDLAVVWRSIAEEGLREGGFEEPATFIVNEADSLVLADVDDDGALDLLVGQELNGGDVVGLFRGDPGGSFLRPQSFSTAGSLVWADDFNGDGEVDLASAGAERATVLFQGERGGLVFGSRNWPRCSKPHFVDVGYLDGDGHLDVVAANSSGGFSVFFGRGDGSFEPINGSLCRDIPTNNNVVIALDLDQSGTDDLVFRDWGGSTLTVLGNRGDGDFDEPVFFESLPGPLFLRKADVDGDGLLDALATGVGRLAVHFGDGRGGFGERRDYEVGNRPFGAVAGDLDGDGHGDLLVANNLSWDVSILLQTDSPRDFAAAVSVSVAETPQDVALADLDLDGDLDVAVANFTSEDVAVLRNPGDGVLEASVPGSSGRFPLDRIPLVVLVGDYNQDGFVDVATTNRAESSISILPGRGDGTFGPVRHFGQGRNPRFAVNGDLDSDGDLDICVAHRGGDLFVLLNEAAAPTPTEEFIRTICTPVDFENVSVPDANPPSERRSLFLLPARDDAGLLETVFVNVARYHGGRDFLREAFPERFGDLSELGYAELVLRHERRDYFAGSVRRLRLDDGSIAYGFDVLTDPASPKELLSLDETRTVFTRLRQAFQLEPLVYFPSSIEAREVARGWAVPNPPDDLPIVIVEEKPPPPPVRPANPTFFLEIAPETTLCGVFAQAGAGRGPRQEYELKTLVRLRAGTVVLPTENESFPADLVEEVFFGPERVVAEPEEAGTFRVVRIPADVTTYRFTYAKPYTLLDGRRLEIEIVSPFTFRARGEEPVEEVQRLPEEFFVALKGREALQAKIDEEPLLAYGSCAYESLPAWRIEAELADGSVLRLDERFEEAASLVDTGPASLTRAELILQPASSKARPRVVTDYFDLVYSATRHNKNVDYWVILDPPMVLEDGDIAEGGEVHAVELRAPEGEPMAREATAAYLGADFEVLRTVGVTRFSREARTEVLFRRGDGDGDGTLSVLDARLLLDDIFGRSASLSCAKAGDANDDGRLNIVDAIAIVSLLFQRGDALPEPFAQCGRDPTEDALSCGIAPCP